ncbi:MAG: cyanophycinase [Chitinophagaceae bacterium]|nr:cyanophycinase [Chitinophagaceae bacterium]
MKPKGTLLIIGGAEDRGDDYIPKIAAKDAEFKRYEILNELLPREKKAKIELVTIGSDLSPKAKKNYKAAFIRIGYSNVGFINIGSRLEAQEQEYLHRLQEACAIFFSGGDQFQIATILGGTAIAELVKTRYYKEADFIVAGTSAGAMVMSSVMMAETSTDEAMLKNDLRTSGGFGLLEHCIIDTHFVRRGRFARLAHAITVNPDKLGVGLGEDAALIIRKGTEAECRGSGMVVVIDGKGIRQTNIADTRDNCPVFVGNLKVDILISHCRFLLDKRMMQNPAIKPEVRKEQFEPV